MSDTLRSGAAVAIAHSAFPFNTDMRLPNTLAGIIGKVQEGWCPIEGGNLPGTLTVGLCGSGDEGHLIPFKRAASLNLDMAMPVDPTFNLGLVREPRDWFGDRASRCNRRSDTSSETNWRNPACQRRQVTHKNGLPADRLATAKYTNHKLLIFRKNLIALPISNLLKSRMNTSFWHGSSYFSTKLSTGIVNMKRKPL